MIDWSKANYFSPNENWGDVYKVIPELVYKLNDLRKHVEKAIIIHEAYATKGHSPRSYHYLGMAADCHIDGLNVIDQFLVAERFGWGGIGVYGRDVWKNPGLHLDIRPNPARWGAMLVDGKMQYVPLDSKFIKHLIELEERKEIVNV